ncbi:MAG: hypothetical protein ACR2Q4_20690 [Geminicoccaceae bacterium]
MRRLFSRPAACKAIAAVCTQILLVVPVYSLAPQHALASPKTDPVVQAERCRRLVEIFDQIVRDRYDFRLLRVDERQLEEARDLRDQAERDCTDGELWFGVTAAEDALLKIGYLPWNTEPRPLNNR